MKNQVKLLNLNQINPADFEQRYVGCVVLTKEHQILLQQRGKDWDRFPGYLATFGGRVEKSETQMQGLIRELHEELGAKVNTAEVTNLGVMTEAITQHRDLVYLYFWQDKKNSITGCYEGEPRYYPTISDALGHPKIMHGLRFALHECQRRGILI